RRGVEDGETDFLVAHPDLGLLIVEVKGGHIRYEGVEDQWYTYSVPIKDPFKQGRKNKYSLLEKLKELPYWRNRWVTVGYSVAFPDVKVKGDLRLDAPRQLILDAEDMNRLYDWVDEALHYLRGRRPDDTTLGRTGIEELITTLSPSHDLPPLLSIEIIQQEAEQERLTDQQFTMLNFISRHRRVAISGCAGSGKTMLAYKKALSLAKQNFNVLLTCFNVNLAEWLLEESQKHRPANLQITNFHKLAEALVQDAGLSLDRNAPGYFDSILPEQLLEAGERLGGQYDAIIVDEAQDFDDNWWLPLQNLLHDPDNGLFFVFFDDNQNIYRSLSHLPLEEPPFALTRNCRNTQAIHRQVVHFYRSDQMPTASGPAGRSVEYHTYTDAGQLKRQLRQILHHLIVEEDVPAWDLVLLTPKGRNRSQLWRLGQLGNFHLVDYPSSASGEVYCETIHSFKGLESPVVILAEIDNDTAADLETLLYVGCSRARNHLVLLTDANLSEHIQMKLKENR
ncbi:MAG: ATP-binding domain-containing protein, partial [Anaerolineae bacterium]|nr:ATP-binding domain-containing protein [Anaerolineae bacterium]